MSNRFQPLMAFVASLVVMVCPFALAEGEPVPAADQAAASEPAGPAPQLLPEPVPPVNDPPADQPKQTPAEQKQAQEKMRLEMQQLERQLREIRANYKKSFEQDKPKPQDTSLEKLEQLKLPAEPTREQYVDYVAALREISKMRASSKTNSLMNEKLRALPIEHVDLLIAEIANRTRLQYFANNAIRGIDAELLRPQFIKTLQSNPNAISVIVMNGWCQDVRPVILRKIESADASLTPAWFQAAVELAEPELYPKLHEITTNSRYAHQFLGMLKTLPDYDFAHTVNVCWEKTQDGTLRASSTYIAPMAASYGNVDALSVLVSQLRGSTSYIMNPSSYNIRRLNVLSYIEFNGSNREIQAWFDQHRDELVFDQFRKQYVIPEDF